MMKIIKSIISLLIVFSLMAMPCAIAEEKTYDYTEEIEFLTKLGLSGVNSSVVDSELSRAEAAVFLAAAVNADTSAAYKIFTDVSETNAAFGAVWYLHSIGAISNSADSLFRAADKITYHEFIKMAAVILGYQAYAQIKGGYPFGYTASASEAGILGKTNSDAVFTKGEAFAIIYKMLFANKLGTDGIKFDETGDASSVSFVKGNLLIADAYKLTIHRGELRASYFASIYGPVAPSEDTVVIDNKSYHTIVDVALEDVGRTVDYYLTEDNIVYLIVPVEATTYTITSDNILPTTTPYQVQYKDENKNTKKLNISLGVYYMYNARPLTGPADSTMKPAYGRLELIDTDKDRDIDVVKIWDFKSYYIKDMSSEYIYVEKNANNVEQIQVKNTAKTVTYFNRFMEKIDESLVLPGKVITVAETTDNLIIILSDNLFTGTLEAIDRDGKAIIDGFKYNYISGLDLSECFGIKLKYYIDANETIVHTNFESNEEYAVLYGVKSDGVFDTNLQIKLFDKGYFDIYDCTEKVRFSENGGAAYSSLDHAALKTKLESYMTAYGKNLIKFSTRAGKINKIILPKETTAVDENRFHLSLNKPNNEYQLGGRQLMLEVNGPYYVWSNQGSHVYIISDDEDKCSFSTMYGKYHEKQSGAKVTGVRGYDLTEAGYFKYITVDMGSGGTGNTEKVGEGASLALITGRQTVLDTDGEPMEVVTAWTHSTSLATPAYETEFSPIDPELTNTGRAKTADCDHYADGTIAWAELKAGDVIQYSVDGFSGRVNAFCVLTRAEDMEDDHKCGNWAAHTQNDAVITGTITVKDPNAIRVKNSLISHDFYGDSEPLMLDTTTSTTSDFDKIYKYNKQAETFEAITANDLYEGAKIWCYMRDRFWQYGLVIIIIE